MMRQGNAILQLFQDHYELLGNAYLFLFAQTGSITSIWLTFNVLKSPESVHTEIVVA
jgi:hypothetical protein